jgi:hypothetical protein
MHVMQTVFHQFEKKSDHFFIFCWIVVGNFCNAQAVPWTSANSAIIITFYILPSPDRPFGQISHKSLLQIFLKKIQHILDIFSARGKIATASFQWNEALKP